MKMNPHPYGQAFAAKDLDRLLSLLADDVTYHSPLVRGQGFEGRDSVAAILGIALDVFKDDEYMHDLGDEHSHVLVANSFVADQPVKTTTLLEFDTEGKIRDIWLMVRPLTGMTAIAGAVGRRVEGRDPGVRDLAKPLADLAAMIDRTGTRMIVELNASTP
jgi:SnoaL-like protein